MRYKLSCSASDFVLSVTEMEALRSLFSREVWTLTCYLTNLIRNLINVIILS